MKKSKAHNIVNLGRSENIFDLPKKMNIDEKCFKTSDYDNDYW